MRRLRSRHLALLICIARVGTSAAVTPGAPSPSQKSVPAIKASAKPVPTPVKKRHVRRDPWLSYRISLLWINAVAAAQVAENDLNPKNIQEIPRLQGISELRSDIKAEIKNLHAIIRPRFRYNPHEIDSQGNVKAHWNKTEFHFTEANLQWTVSDQFTLAYGLQNFQWGPAETISPSNRIFHDPVQARDALFEYRGRHLARINFTPAQAWSFVVLAELSNNGEASFIADEPFEKKVLLKTEYGWDAGANYLGLVLGARQNSGAWVGEYGSISLTEGLSLYFDAAHASGARTWYPTTRTDAQGNAVTTLAQSMATDPQINTLAALGARYVFTGGSDLKLEYVYDSSAYTTEERTRLQTALTSTQLAQLSANVQNRNRLLSPGLEFPGLHQFFASLRVPEFLAIRDLSLYTRYMHSLTDSSGTAFSSLELAIGTAGTLFASGAFSHGDPMSELRGFVSYSVMAGYQHAW